ncbi:hypothetical protein PR048_009741 [Dryococelus australis]|uniref:Uncharacterized protein n=1 Tax=Dryococelus australis TaxID=614101 RepID=A0ABQ9I0R1_9NEOP|nr:hypothetical protein PR048_009741 [Dryococelus australis]
MKFARGKETTCFFCNKVAGREGLHDASTSELDARVRTCVRLVEDNDPLGRLSAGDMVALEPKYHTSSLKMLDDWLERSVWAEALVEAEFATEGTADSFLKAAPKDTNKNSSPIEEESMGLISIGTKEIAGPQTVNVVKKVKAVGLEQFQAFTTECFINKMRRIDDTIH